MAIHLSHEPVAGNSYPQTGQALLLLSISIAHDGHSFLLIELTGFLTPLLFFGVLFLVSDPLFHRTL